MNQPPTDLYRFAESAALHAQQQPPPAVSAPSAESLPADILTGILTGVVAKAQESMSAAVRRSRRIAALDAIAVRDAIRRGHITEADIRRVDGRTVTLWNGRRITIDRRSDR